jgi:hypothetical protein
MKALGIFSKVNNEAGLIIVAEVNTPFTERTAEIRTARGCTD